MRPARTRRARHRQRAEPLDEARCRGPRPGRPPVWTAPKATTWAKIAGHQVVDVVDARDVDRPAEDVAEHQHEQQRLDRGEHQELRHAPDGEQVAPGHGERRRARPAERRPRPPATGMAMRGRRRTASFSRSARSAAHLVDRLGPARPAVPVRARNTSSSEGSRTPAVARLEPRGVERAHGGDQRARAVGHVQAHACAPSRATVAELQAPRARRRPRPPRPRRASVSSTHGGAEAAPSARRRCPRRWRVPRSITTMRSASRSASSRYWVVEQHRGPVGHQLVDHVPQVVAARRIEARGGLVEEQHRRPVDERGGQVEPAAHAAGVGAGRAVGGVRRGRSARAARRRAGRSRAGAGGSGRPISSRFSRPVRLPSTAANCPARPMRARTSRGVARPRRGPAPSPRRRPAR